MRAVTLLLRHMYLGKPGELEKEELGILRSFLSLLEMVNPPHARLARLLLEKELLRRLFSEQEEEAEEDDDDEPDDPTLVGAQELGLLVQLLSLVDLYDLPLLRNIAVVRATLCPLSLQDELTEVRLER